MERLPSVLWYEIVPYLSIRTLGRVSQTSRVMRHHFAIEWTIRQRLARYTTMFNALKLRSVGRKLVMLLKWKERVAYGHRPPRTHWLLRSRAFVREAVQLTPDCLRYAGWERWMADREIVLVAVRGGGFWIPTKFREDEEMVRAFLFVHPTHGVYALGPQMRATNRDLVLFALKCGGGINLLDEEQQNDKELGLAAVRYCRHQYRYLSDRLQADHEILRTLISKSTPQQVARLVPEGIMHEMLQRAVQ